MKQPQAAMASRASRLEVAVIGAGIAGASTAYFLGRSGLRAVALFERENVPDRHSTGRNAAIFRTAMPDPLLHGLARESADFYRAPPPGFASRPLIDPVELFLAAAPEAFPRLSSWALDPRCTSGAVPAEPGELRRRVPALAEGLGGAIRQPGEGVIDVHGVHQGFLRGARERGAELRLEQGVQSLVIRDGRVAGVRTRDGVHEAEQVVIATGGWAAELAAAAGFPLPFQATRRHLLVSQPLTAVDPRWPVVWISGGGDFYFRPESGGLLMCACDQVEVAPGEGEAVDRNVLEDVALKAQRWLPGLPEVAAAHFWAGMRTFAPDERFAIGPDPRLPGLHWVAGLGGHGITCAPAIGRLAAEWIVQGRAVHPAAAALAPARLVAQTARPAPAPQG